MSRWARLGSVVGFVAAMLCVPPAARAILIREVRAVQAELKGFGYVELVGYERSFTERL